MAKGNVSSSIINHTLRQRNRNKKLEGLEITLHYCDVSAVLLTKVLSLAKFQLNQLIVSEKVN